MVFILVYVRYLDVSQFLPAEMLTASDGTTIPGSKSSMDPSWNNGAHVRYLSKELGRNMVTKTVFVGGGVVNSGTLARQAGRGSVDDREKKKFFFCLALVAGNFHSH